MFQLGLLFFFFTIKSKNPDDLYKDLTKLKKESKIERTITENNKEECDMILKLTSKQPKERVSDTKNKFETLEFKNIIIKSLD